MDKLFGGNQGEEDMRRMEAIRQELGITPGGSGLAKKEAKVGVSEVEKV